MKQLAVNLAVVVGVAIAVAAAVASISRSSAGPTVSNLGVAVDGIAAPGVTVWQANLLGTRSGHDLYRVETNAGTCLAIGEAGSTTTGRVACPFDTFTSGPVRALVTVASAEGGPFIASRAEGLAADGVDVVEVAGANGTTLATARVQGNVFSVPLKVPVAGMRIIARDKAGDVVDSISY